MTKMDSFVYLRLLPELWSLECQNGSFYVLFAENSKKSVPVWARYLGVSERSYLALLENVMDYGVLSCH